MDGGGIGAVSVGIPGWLLWLLIPTVIVLLAAGVWKIVKFFWVIGG